MDGANEVAEAMAGVKLTLEGLDLKLDRLILEMNKEDAGAVMRLVRRLGGERA